LKEISQSSYAFNSQIEEELPPEILVLDKSNYLGSKRNNEAFFVSNNVVALDPVTAKLDAEIHHLTLGKDTYSNLDTNIGMEQYNAANKAISDLLGLDQSSARLSQRDRSLDLAEYGQMANMQRFQNELNNQPNEWAQALGGIVGGGLQGLAQGYGASLSDRRFKENIREIGIADEGFPIVEFNYKGNGQRYRGRLESRAHQVGRRVQPR